MLERILLLLIAGIYRDSLIISSLGAVSLFGTAICIAVLLLFEGFCPRFLSSMLSLCSIRYFSFVFCWS